MACKHEGGTDKCVRAKQGYCIVQRREYYRENYNTGRDSRNSLTMGYVSELLVAADLNARCDRAYLNPQPQTPDDVFVKTSLGWCTVQVKMGRVHRGTGRINLKHARHISSDILALVDVETRRVRYVAWAKPLPPELPTEPSDICSTFYLGASESEESCRSTNMSVPIATSETPESSPSAKRKTSTATSARAS